MPKPNKITPKPSSYYKPGVYDKITQKPGGYDKTSPDPGCYDKISLNPGGYGNKSFDKTTANSGRYENPNPGG